MDSTTYVTFEFVAVVSDLKARDHTSAASIAKPACVTCHSEIVAQLVLCHLCNEVLCLVHWDEWEPHKKTYRNWTKRRQVNLLVNGWAESLMDSYTDPQQRRKLYEEDHQNYWFGIDTKDGNFVIENDLYLDIIRSSNFQDHEQQFPSLVSFVGATGSGKSTIIVSFVSKPLFIISGEQVPHSFSHVTLFPKEFALIVVLLKKGLITVDEESETSFQTPVPGASGGTTPTSSDVHLYADPKTIHTDHPILFVDCEGLQGGNQEPSAYLEKAHRFGR
jgi:hypothetical protein